MNKCGIWLAPLVFLLLSDAAGQEEPELAWIKTSAAMVVGAPAHCTLTVSWTGSARDYAVWPATWDGCDWADVTLKTVESVEEDGRVTVAQTFEVIPNLPGAHALPNMQVRLDWRDPTQRNTVPDRPTTETRVLEGPGTTVRRWPVWVWPALAGGATAAAGALAAVRRRQKRSASERH